VSGWDFPSLSLSPSFLPSFLPSFSQTPRHHTAELVLGNDLLKLSRHQLRGIPSPEELVGGIEKVLSARLVVRDPISSRELPRSSNVGIRTPRAECVLTSSTAVLFGRTAVTVLRTTARRTLGSLLRTASPVIAYRNAPINWLHMRLLKRPCARCQRVFACDGIFGYDDRAVQWR
jgi:hypothetical protein